MKLLLPYGDPTCTAVFLHLSPGARTLIDGIAVDIPGFERLHEQLVHQVCFSRPCPIMEDVRRYRLDPYLVMAEDLSVSSKDIDTADRGRAAVRLSRVRVPLPGDAPALDNLIAERKETGAGPSTRMLGVSDPSHQHDGPRCHVHFATVEGAVSYDAWVSTYEDGRGAMRLGPGWVGPGGCITGLRPGSGFYAFVTCWDSDGKVSRPSPPFRSELKDRLV